MIKTVIYDLLFFIEFRDFWLKIFVFLGGSFLV